MGHGANREVPNMLSFGLGRHDIGQTELGVEEMKVRMAELKARILNPGLEDDVNALIQEKETLNTELRDKIQQLRSGIRTGKKYLDGLRSDNS